MTALLTCICYGISAYAVVLDSLRSAIGFAGNGVVPKTTDAAADQSDMDNANR
ncbi:hypothetical protein V1281_003808 [Nitrobacteraceae bacterium AZCC 2161]|jgi:hypothetical protein